MDFSPSVFAGQAVAKLMNGGDDTDQDPKLDDIGQALVGEVIELQIVPSDFGPMAYQYIRRERAHGETQQQELVGKNKPYPVVDFGKRNIRIPGRERDLSQVAPQIGRAHRRGMAEGPAG